MTIATLHPLHDARVTGLEPVTAGGRAPLGARAERVYAVGGCTPAFGFERIDGRKMQGVRGHDPLTSTIDAGVGRGARTRDE